MTDQNELTPKQMEQIDTSEAELVTTIGAILGVSLDYADDEMSNLVHSLYEDIAEWGEEHKGIPSIVTYPYILREDPSLSRLDLPEQEDPEGTDDPSPLFRDGPHREDPGSLSRGMLEEMEQDAKWDGSNEPLKDMDGTIFHALDNDHRRADIAPLAVLPSTRIEVVFDPSVPINKRRYVYNLVADSTPWYCEWHGHTVEMLVICPNETEDPERQEEIESIAEMALTLVHLGDLKAEVKHG